MISAEEFAKKSREPIDEKGGYILGKRGQLWTQKNQDAATDDMIRKYGQKWVGKHVWDCSGLVKWALLQLGSDCAHGSNSIWSRYLQEKGATSGHEMQNGEVVFKHRIKDGKHDYYHIGVYQDGYVNQAASTAKGCVRTKFDSSWTHYGKLKDVEYGPQKEKEAFQLGDYKVVAEHGSSVRMRKGPFANAGIVMQVPTGAEVKVTEDVNEKFVAIEYTIKGYMMKDFLKKE